MPSTLVTHVGDTITWTLSGFHNRTGNAVADFTIIDMPGRGLNFSMGRMPAFTNGAGVTYDIRYRVAGSNQWNILMQGVSASAPFTFGLPQPGNVYYTEIRFDFGTVPASFGLGNTIALDFIVGNNAPNNVLINDFFVSFNNNSTQGQSPQTPIVIPRPPTNGNLVGDGDRYIELDDNNVPQGEWTWNPDDNRWVFNPFNPPTQVGRLPQTGSEHAVYWIGSLVLLMMTGGLGSLIFVKANKKKKRAKYN